ncbi:MAG TPA: PH domain-containing protein [Pseudonocardiaceae bacterium]|nr:PH domain-containing protein [Pseudonocardiaceae bacterium]
MPDERDNNATIKDPATGLTLPGRLVFRIPGSALVGVLFLVMCSSWVAVASPWFTLVYLLPLGIAVWVVRTRTVVDADKLVIRRVLWSTELPWSAISALRVADRKWIRAVRTDGGEVVLPTVRTRHLPALALISGGRLPDPTE